jgi:hypothetical protein
VIKAVKSYLHGTERGTTGLKSVRHRSLIGLINKGVNIMGREDIIDFAFERIEHSSVINDTTYKSTALIGSHSHEETYDGIPTAKHQYPVSLVVKLTREEELATSTIADWSLCDKPLDVEVKGKRYKGSVFNVRLAQAYYDDHIIEIALTEI